MAWMHPFVSLAHHYGPSQVALWGGQCSWTCGPVHGDRILDVYILWNRHVVAFYNNFGFVFSALERFDAPSGHCFVEREIYAPNVWVENSG